LSLSENNNLSKVLKLLYSQALSFYFLTVTQVCRQNMEMEALKGFQRLCSPKVTKEGYATCPADDTEFPAVSRGVKNH
jgi:hypothetical protein